MHNWNRAKLQRALLGSIVAVAAIGGTSELHAQRKVIDPFSPDFQCLEGFRKVRGQCFKICPEGTTAAGPFVDECVKAAPRPAPFAKRGFFGACPSGYVDHPTDPKQCALPAVAHQILRRIR